MKRTCIRFRPGLALVVIGLAVGLPGAIVLRAQDQGPERLPTFEVASVKENVSGDSRARVQTLPGGRFVATNVLLKGQIADAFLGAQPLALSRVLGGPEWIGSTRYDIIAKASSEFQLSPDGPPVDLLLMLRSLLQAWTPEQIPTQPPPPGVPPIDPNGPSFVTALQEQLGLKLVSAKGPVDVVVIDSVERPTPD